jgi:hypothetical protein
VLAGAEAQIHRYLRDGQLAFAQQLLGSMDAPAYQISGGVTPIFCDLAS